MKKSEIRNLIALGKEIDITVKEVVVNGVPGVCFCDVETVNYLYAHRELMRLKFDVACGG